MLVNLSFGVIDMFENKQYVTYPYNLALSSYFTAVILKRPASYISALCHSPACMSVTCFCVCRDLSVTLVLQCSPVLTSPLPSQAN